MPTHTEPSDPALPVPPGAVGGWRDRLGRSRRLRRRAGIAVGVSLLVVATSGCAALRSVPQFRPGAAGIGDAYFPLDGNGGYEVSHYGLELAYDPGTDALDGVATLDVTATQDLARFDLDLDGLTVRSVTVDGVTVAFRRRNGELKITPPQGIRTGRRFEVVVSYDGVPRPLPADEGGGVVPTADGVLVAGQPHAASTWFPVNDHPRDKAAYDIAITVPEGLEAVANGALVSHDTTAGETRWVWSAPAPMASYLALFAVGEFRLTEYHDDGGRPGGIDYVDAVDPHLGARLRAHGGIRFAVSQAGQPTYKRLRRTIAVPRGGATLSFFVNRDTEADYDHVFVEAHTAGRDDWTTLADANGHTVTDPGSACPDWLELHPFLTHYQTHDGADGCAPMGATGTWTGASGRSDDWEQWNVNLAPFAGTTIELSISYASDDGVQGPGVAVDDIEVSTGQGTTSFEADGNVMDGWVVPGAPRGSVTNVNDWIVGTAEAGPAPVGVGVRQSLERQPEIVAFLADLFGPYPFADAGAIVDDVPDLGFALETQTRPVYAPDYFNDREEGDATVVHELTHQWFGDRLALPAWRHIWLNEGFASYAEWLWSDHEGLGTTQEIFDDLFATPAADPFWSLEIGDPGADDLFDDAVYERGAMTLHALRREVGETDFFDILRRWASAPPGRTATTRNFIALAERVSGQELSPLFHEWLRTTDKPALTAAAAAAVGQPSEAAPSVPGRRGPARR